MQEGRLFISMKVAHMALTLKKGFYFLYTSVCVCVCVFMDRISRHRQRLKGFWIGNH